MVSAPVADSLAAVLSAARLQMDAGELEVAADLCLKAIDIAPRDASGFAMLALLRLTQGEFAPAASAATAAIDLAPGEGILNNLASAIALKQRRPHRALEFTRQALALDPCDRRALADRAIALTELGAAPSPDRHQDFQRRVTVTEVQAPPRFVDLGDYNRVFALAIDASPDLDRQAGNTLVGGARLHDVFALPEDIVGTLREAFLAAIGAYREQVGDPLDDLMPSRHDVTRSTVRGWANVMPAGAFERPHIHEGAWLSAVYYVEMPPVSADPVGEPAGLRFGGHDDEDARPWLGPTLSLLPRPGQLILFPSWIYHRTLPFAGLGRRVSVALDLVRR